jgi:hypothetical protein
VRRLQLAVFLVAAAACGRRGALITVHNDSRDTLRSLALSGPGFADTLPELTPGQLSALRVRPRGEAGIGVAFTAGDRRISVPEQGYFESAGGYVVLVRVDSTLGVAVDVTLGQY